MRIVGLAFLVWRVGLFFIEKIAHVFWSLREGFLGQETAWANFDGAHYTQIARWGYGGYQQAFFPLYPFLIRVVHRVTQMPYEYAAVFISHIAFFIGLALFWRYLPPRHRLWTLVFLLAYPASFFFVAAYSESVFFALSAGSLLAMKNKRWILAGVFVALASATRLVGVFLIFSLIFARRWLAAAVAPLGLFTYMAYLWLASGDPLAFFHVQPAFGAGRSGGELIVLPQVFWRYARIFTTVPPTDLLYYVAAIELGSFLFGTTLLVLAWRGCYDRGLLLYGTCVLLIPTLTGTLSSMPRYILAAFPLFSVLNEMKSRVGKFVVAVTFLGLLVYAETGFLRGYFMS